VGGAWVGGEHRCIHFRTGAMGEGSKTALPIFGYFMERVLKDPSLVQYRGKFPKPKEKITVPYECHTVYTPVADSTLTDSLGTAQEGVVETEILNQDVEELKIEEGDTKTEEITP